MLFQIAVKRGSETNGRFTNRLKYAVAYTAAISCGSSFWRQCHVVTMAISAVTLTYKTWVVQFVLLRLMNGENRFSTVMKFHYISSVCLSCRVMSLRGRRLALRR